jgi:biopolymer transport protein ExbB
MRTKRRLLKFPGPILFSIVLLISARWLFAAAPPAGRPAGEEAKGRTFLHLLIRGGWFMVPIGVASLVGFALVTERAIALRRSRIIPPGFMEGLKNHGDDRQAAVDYCHRHPSPIARVILAGLRRMSHGEVAAERAMEDAGGNEIHKLRRNLRMMYGVSVISPMLGLLGTVWGMIEAFRVTSQAQGLGKPEQLAGGIYEALVTTLAGLMVAIPVVMFYYYFVQKIEGITGELNDAAMDFTDQFFPDGVRETKAKARSVA